MDGGGAYGAGRAGAPFNPVTFIKKPEVITRLISLFFAIIVFSCLAAKGYDDRTKDCLIYAGSSACSYGIGIGVIAFLLCIAFLVVDAMFDQLSNIQQRKYAVLADIGVSGLWCFLWFVGFCYMTNMWARTPNKSAFPINVSRSDIQAALAFSFFSTLSWAAQVVLAVMRYRKGVTENFGTEDTTPRPDIAQSSNPYASFGGEVGQSTYQQAPFSGQPDPPSQPAAPPTY